MRWQRSRLTQPTHPLTHSPTHPLTLSTPLCPYAATRSPSPTRAALTRIGLSTSDPTLLSAQACCTYRSSIHDTYDALGRSCGHVEKMVPSFLFVPNMTGTLLALPAAAN